MWLPMVSPASQTRMRIYLEPYLIKPLLNYPDAPTQMSKYLESLQDTMVFQHPDCLFAAGFRVRWRWPVSSVCHISECPVACPRWPRRARRDGVEPRRRQGFSRCAALETWPQARPHSGWIRGPRAETDGQRCRCRFSSESSAAVSGTCDAVSRLAELSVDRSR